jgi:hypothetical protein
MNTDDVPEKPVLVLTDASYGSSAAAISASGTAIASSPVICVPP